MNEPIANSTNRVLDHRRDAAWLIQLWLAIHGGDPVPGELRIVQREAGDLATIRAIVALARCLDNAHVEQQVVAALKPIVERVGGQLREELAEVP